jgi:hypothetical protein
MHFWVCHDREPRRWVVRRDDKIYGEYLSRERAVLDAIEAAADARQSGCDAEVWDRSTNARLA